MQITLSRTGYIDLQRYVFFLKLHTHSGANPERNRKFDYIHSSFQRHLLREMCREVKVLTFFSGANPHQQRGDLNISM